jgi:hypothetical protein
LRYRFEPNQSYHYDLKGEVDFGERVMVTAARCSYSTSTPKESPATPKEPFEVTGTAFVVHTDGYLMTCAHVIEDGERIEVTLGGKKYAAQAVESDDVLDIALLKIEARGLAAVPLANSDSVQVGQEVRAIGFPLSEVLGSSLKATRGTVSGIDTIDGGKRFQIDASVNGGNSGGPLVTEGGQVVGVVNAKLTGSAISNVGFAVPVNFAKRMLSGQNVKFTAGTADQKLEGPALFQKVQPSVALVSVTLDRAAAAGVQTLRASGYASTSERAKSGQRPASPTSASFGSGKPVEIQIDSRGQVLDLSGETPKMAMAGPVPLVIFEPLPADSRTKWSTHREYTMEIESGDDKPTADRDIPFGPRGFGPGGFDRDRFGPGGFGRGPIGPRFGGGAGRSQQPAAKQVRKLPAVEDTNYTIEDRSGDLVTIVKRFEMKAQETGGKMALAMTGEGKLTFHAKLGLPKQMDYRGTIEVSQGNVSVKFPFTLTYEQTDGKPPAAPPAVANGAPPAAATPTPSTPEQPARPAPAAPDKAFVPVASRAGKLAVRASGIEGKKTPDLAFDGDKTTAWGAGGWPVQWIEADLMKASSLAAIKLTVAQLPASETEHEIWISEAPLGAERSGGKLIHTFRGSTKTDDVLQFEFPANTTARYVQIRTIKSRSWVAWLEIDIRVQ